MKTKLLVLCVSIFGGLLNAFGQYVTPSAYTATPGEGVAQGASYNYFDETGRQLIDNVLGSNNLSADLGNGPAYEWVGWRLANPTLIFQFPNPAPIGWVRIGFHHNTTNQTYLPSLVTIGERSYTLTGAELDNGTRGFLEFPGYWLTNSLIITLSDSNSSRWIFVDEVQFIAQGPEPAYYTATPAEGVAQGAPYNYFDDTGTQLLDHVLGASELYQDLGFGPAYEWVGWRHANPTLTFQFTNTTLITSVQIGFHHNDYNQTYVPKSVRIGSRSYSLTGAELANGTRGFLDFPGYWFTNALTITLSDNDSNRWIFVDEVRFFDTPRLLSTQISTATEICWPSLSNSLYQVEYRTRLDTDQWLPLAQPVLATGTQSCVLDSTRASPRKYYRVRDLGEN
jgi:hypothetical protein